jgi:hypothetical protein
MSPRAIVLALPSLLVVGCASAPGPAPSAAPAYLGTVTAPDGGTGQDAVVGVVSDGSSVSFYLCGGPLSYATVTRWFQGDVTSGQTFTLAPSGGFTGGGDLGAGAGQILTDTGETLAWTVREAAGADEGLYSAVDGSCRTGAVAGDLDGNGTVRLQGTWCDGLGHFAQVSPLSPNAMFTAQGIDVEVLGEDVPTFFVERVLQPL